MTGATITRVTASFLLICAACTDSEQVFETAPLLPPDLEPVTTTAAPSFEDWSRSAVELIGSDGEQFTFTCPAGGMATVAWGTDIYTHDSSVCTAAVHAGLIDFEDGGVVVIELRPGEPSYLGTTANGVTTESYPAWERSFVFVD